MAAWVGGSSKEKGTGLWRSRRRRRGLRLRGFQLALAFKDLCNGIAEAKVEIVVREGELGETVAAAVGQLKATTLVLGIHDKSFIYSAPSPSAGVSSLGCRVLAIRHNATARHGFLEAELIQIETIRLHVPPPKIPFPIFTLPLGVIWKRSSSKRRK